MVNFFTELKGRCISRVAIARAVVACVLFQCVNNVAPILAAESPRRVFLLQGLTSSEPALGQAMEAIKQRLTEGSSEGIEVYTDFLDLEWFRGPENENRLAQFLGAKLTQARPEVIVAVSREAIDFAVRHRIEFAPGIPIVYCCAPASAMVVPPDIPGVVNQMDWPGTLALAERLQPNAKTLVFISGASDSDRRRDEDALQALRPFLQKYDTKYLIGLPRDVLLKEVSRLPSDSIVLMRRVFQDGSGRSRGADIAEEVSKASTSPVYSISPTYFGSGIVGGSMDNFMVQAVKVADLALDILSGKDPTTLPHQTELPLQYRVDARQLERWGFAEASLPPGTSVEFRQPTLWEQYRNTIILVLLAFGVLVGIIALLLFEIQQRRKAEEARKAAEAESDLRRKEVNHIMRVATLSELSGGIAHELGQPLSAILANAQAAQALLADKDCNKEEIAEILEEIVQQDSRAGEVIHRLRRLLKKEEHPKALIDLNDLITSTLRLLHSELVNRNVRVETKLKVDLPPILGDSVQLKQVLLNLMMNAMEAMASIPASKRTLEIGTRTTEEGYAEISIRDHGPGMSPDELKRLFEPYFTTKKQGLGLGLSICSAIVRSHHGQLNLSNSSDGGVTAIISLPLSLCFAAAS